MNKIFINKIASIVNECENNGLYKQADKLNLLMTRIAQVKGTLMPNGQFIPDTTNTPQSPQIGQGGQSNPEQANTPQQPQNQPQMGKYGDPGTMTAFVDGVARTFGTPTQQLQPVDTSAGYPRRQQPDFYKNIAYKNYSQYLSSGYNTQQSLATTLQSVSREMQKNLEIPYYHNLLLNEIKNSISTVQQSSIQPTVIDQTKLPQISRTASFRDQLINK
jgi:hypothetical protein